MTETGIWTEAKAKAKVEVLDYCRSVGEDEGDWDSLDSYPYFIYIEFFFKLWRENAELTIDSIE